MTAKTIKRLAILTAILGLIGGTAIWAQRYQLNKMAASVIARAKRAEEKREFSEAERLYQQHLEVVQGDTDVMLQYADMLSRADDTLKRQQEAMGLYTEVLKRFPGRVDVRRRRMDLEFKMGNFRAARADLAILLPTADDDGELQFKMGRSCEAEGDDTNATISYRAAIKNRAPQRLEA
jgi:tetratricopeptide (TPR) repeat protein